MRLELYRPSPNGDILTLMLWRKGDKLPEVMAEYRALLKRRGMERFMPTHALVRGPRGAVKGRWNLAA